ncbi:hypothetical protein PENSUB_4460 [Penicillium subrubescens]|uniref:Uncharacterized protein n=1 Tax=Penicillium subrubescens TaxID=1316194 RepID=A0A1Q5UC99_9EURO|nr:hypothetical protein PENSUB_4460 [Penicillium subrubescens]
MADEHCRSSTGFGQYCFKCPRNSVRREGNRGWTTSTQDEANGPTQSPGKRAQAGKLQKNEVDAEVAQEQK